MVAAGLEQTATDTSHLSVHHRPDARAWSRNRTYAVGFSTRPWRSSAWASMACSGSTSSWRLDSLHVRFTAERAAGRLHRIHHTVYSLVPKELLKRDGLYMAAVLACGPGAVLSHRSAAALLELRDWGHTQIEVTVPRRSARRHDGIKVHRSTILADQDITVVNNIPCTTVARTLFDLAEVVTARQLERSFDQAEILQVLDLKAIKDQLARNPTRPGAKAVRRVLTEHYIGSTPDCERERGAAAGDHARCRPARSQGQLLHRPGRRRPPNQASTSSGASSVSSSRPTAGRRTTRSQRIEIDRERDQRLIAAGWTMIRTTWRQMKFRPRRAAADPRSSYCAGARVSSRARLTSRCRRPSASRDPPLHAAGGSTSSRRRSGPSPHQRCHLDAVEPARDDPAERLEVVLDVHGEPVRGHAARKVHPDRRDLALLNPHAGEPVPVMRPRPARPRPRRPAPRPARSPDSARTPPRRRPARSDTRRAGRDRGR